MNKISLIFLTVLFTLCSCKPSQKLTCSPYPAGAVANGPTTYKKYFDGSSSNAIHFDESVSPIASCSFKCGPGLTHSSSIVNGATVHLCSAETLCTLQNAEGNGVTSILNATQVTGNLGSCTITACDSVASVLSNDAKSCIPKENCSVVDASSNGWDTSLASSASGQKIGSDVSACVVSACGSGYALNTTTKSCGVTAAVCSSTAGVVDGPGNYRFIAKGDGLDYDFCVAKYEAQKDSLSAPTKAVSYGDIALSDARRSPWTTISQANAKIACEANGVGYRLISNKEWQVVAKNIESKSTNWNNGIVGGDFLVTMGHADNLPAKPLPSYSGTGENSTGNLGGLACVYTVNGTSADKCKNGSNIWISGAERRVMLTASGETIWDFAGNAHELTSDNESSIPTLQFLIESLFASLGSDSISISKISDQVSLNNLIGTSSICANPNLFPYCGFGAITNKVPSGVAGGAIIRGGGYASSYNLNSVFTNDSGIRSVYRASSFIDGIPQADTHLPSDSVGFRCVYSR